MECQYLLVKNPMYGFRNVQASCFFKGSARTLFSQQSRNIREDSGVGNGLIIMKSDTGSSPQFAFLVEKALSLGAMQAKVIPAADVVVENRVPLKCRAG